MSLTGLWTSHLSIKWHHFKNQIWSCAIIKVETSTGLTSLPCHYHFKSLAFYASFCLDGKFGWFYRTIGLFSNRVFPWHILIRVPKPWIIFPLCTFLALFFTPFSTLCFHLILKYQGVDICPSSIFMPSYSCMDSYVLFQSQGSVVLTSNWDSLLTSWYDVTSPWHQGMDDLSP